MKTLGERFPEEQARVRGILATCQALGPAGRVGVLMIEDVLRRADQALAAGDVADMIRLYQEMREIQS